MRCSPHTTYKAVPGRPYLGASAPGDPRIRGHGKQPGTAERQRFDNESGKQQVKGADTRLISWVWLLAAAVNALGLAAQPCNVPTIECSSANAT